MRYKVNFNRISGRAFPGTGVAFFPAKTHALLSPRQSLPVNRLVGDQAWRGSETFPKKPARFLCLGQNGQIMVESVVAISMVTIGLLGIFSLLVQAGRFNREAGTRVVATHFAAEGVEIVKSIIDTSIANREPWNAKVPPGRHEVYYDSGELWPDSGGALFFDESAGAYGRDGVRSQFSRRVTLDQRPDGDGRDYISVISEVSVAGGRSVSIEDRFYNWRSPAP